jgi:putative endonuclease
MDKTAHGGWVYILARRYRGEIYVGITADLPARMAQHRAGEGSQYAAERSIDRLVWAEFIEPIEAAIAHEKQLKRWRREWKFALIEKANPEWRDLFDHLAGP